MPTFNLTELIGNKTIDDLKSNQSLQNMLIHNLVNKLEKPMISKYAQVYLLDKRKLVDITDILSQIGKDNFLESIYLNAKVRKQLIYGPLKLDGVCRNESLRR